MKFLMRCDTPNWVVILFFLLCWMLSVLAHFMKNYAEDCWRKAARAQAGEAKP